MHGSNLVDLSFTDHIGTCLFFFSSRFAIITLHVNVLFQGEEHSLSYRRVSFTCFLFYFFLSILVPIPSCFGHPPTLRLKTSSWQSAAFNHHFYLRSGAKKCSYWPNLFDLTSWWPLTFMLAQPITAWLLGNVV